MIRLWGASKLVLKCDRGGRTDTKARSVGGGTKLTESLKKNGLNRVSESLNMFKPGSNRREIEIDVTQAAEGKVSHHCSKLIKQGEGTSKGVVDAEESHQGRAKRGGRTSGKN